MPDTNNSTENKEVEEVLNTEEVDDSIQESVDEEENTKKESKSEVDETNNKEEVEETDEDYNEKAKEYLERYQRTIAEFDNFRKRTIKEKAAMYENGAKEVLEKILPVIDNFERALEHISEDEKESSLCQGVEMIYKQFLSAMTDIGVEEIDAIGKEFDPNLHHAVAHEDNDEYGENEVQAVLQKGYTYKERVLRHSMVKVVN